MIQDQDPKGHWGGYSFADGFGVSVFLSAEAQAEYRAQRNEPDMPIDGDVQEIRKQMDARNTDLARWQDIYPCRIQAAEMAGVPTDIIVPLNCESDANRGRVIINLAGGGMWVRTRMGGQTESVPLAGTGQVRVVSAAYRQAPEYSYPAGSEDAVAVYQDLLNTYDPEKIGIYGGSAGGWMAVQAITALTDRELPVPGALALINSSAIFDGRIGDSLPIPNLAEGKRPLTIQEAVTPDRDDLRYFADVDFNDPLVSPTVSLDVLGRFPPTLIVTATRDFMLSSAAVSHARFLQAGVDSHLYVQEGLGHSFPIRFPGTEEANDAYRRVWDFFNKYLAD